MPATKNTPTRISQPSTAPKPSAPSPAQLPAARTQFSKREKTVVTRCVRLLERGDESG